MKSCEEIFNGVVEFLSQTVGGEKNIAEKITRKNMSKLPYRQDKDCEILKGKMATDEEFESAMKKPA